MATVSKNARREQQRQLVSRWGGKITVKAVFERGRLRYYAECEKSKKRARRPRDLM